MKLALLSPKGPLYRYRNGIFKKSLRYAPLTLTTLSALVPEELDVRVSLYDEGIEEIPLDLSADLIGMTVITGSSTRSYYLADHFRSRGVPVVLGGPHVTLMPDEAAQHADSIVTGYAESTWPQLLREFKVGAMRPRYNQELNFNLDQPVFPERHRLDKRQYLTLDVFEATRSCIHDCEFCIVPVAWGRKPFQKPVEHVVHDITRQEAKKLIFIDLNLISDQNYAAQLFEALIPLKVNWFGLSTTLIGRNPELLDLMARSGCTGLLVGFESITRSNLLQSQKSFNTPKNYQELVAKLHDKGISVMGCFVFGLDDDGLEIFEETAQFVIDTGIDLPRFAIATPFPGTPFFQRLEDEGRILTRSWEHYDGQHVVFQPSRMTVADLAKGHEKAWKMAYRFSSIIKRIGKSRIQIPLSIAANLGYRFYAHNLHQFYNCDWFIGQQTASPLEALAK